MTAVDTRKTANAVTGISDILPGEEGSAVGFCSEH
jgi:hypothetical protein